MPNIEAINKSYEKTKHKLQCEEDNAPFDFPGDMLMNRLSESKGIAFTESLNDMLRQEISEIRAQTNQQVLAFAAIITLLAVIGAAVIGLLA